MALDAQTQKFISDLAPYLQPAVSSACQSFLQSQGMSITGGSTNVPATGMVPSTVPMGCPYPNTPASPNIPGCPVNCDDCAFPQVALDLQLYSFPQVEAELWDQQTSINVIDAGAFPVAPGGSITLSQEARRTLSWIPAKVFISTTWSGGDPQPQFLTYQWASASKGAGPAGVQFAPPMNGSQFECGQNCLTVPFPRYKGCDGVMIGSLSKLQLIVTLSASATSTLESISVVVYHKQNHKKAACCGGCAAGSACSC